MCKTITDTKTDTISYEFLPEHWSIIKSYVGIYHIRTDWDIMKLDNQLICMILAMVSPNDIQNIVFQSNEDRVRCVWKYLHKKKLYDVDILIQSIISNNSIQIIQNI
jgi:hypothetical protein